MPSLQMDGVDGTSNGNDCNMLAMVMDIVADVVQSSNEHCTGQIIFMVSYGNASIVAFWFRDHLDATGWTRYCPQGRMTVFITVADEKMSRSSGFCLIEF